MQGTLADDLAAVARIDAVPKILEVVGRTTGMGFAAVARVTEDRWVACAVRDHIAFGLEPGGELQVKTTICDQVRESGKEIVIDHVANFGEPIPRDTLARLFQPYARASARPYQQGLGLGLYIASEIARAHDGTREVASTPEETRFTFHMPPVAR